MKNWEIIVSVASAAIALASLIFSVCSFERQQRRAEAHARGNVKPLLTIKSQKYVDLKSIRLANYGVGPAVITAASFRRSSTSESTNNIIELFELGIIWEMFSNLPVNRAVPPQTEVVLIKQSLEHLLSQDFDKKSGLAILAEWQKQKGGIEVEISYQDILGNEMPSLKETLS